MFVINVILIINYMVVNYGYEYFLWYGGKIDVFGLEVYVLYRDVIKNYCGKSLLGYVVWSKFLVGFVVIFGLVWRYFGINLFECLMVCKSFFFSSFFEWNIKSFLVLFVGIVYELEDFFVGSKVYSFEGDDDRNEFFERIVLEIEMVGFINDIGFDNLVVCWVVYG